MASFSFGGYKWWKNGVSTTSNYTTSSSTVPVVGTDWNNDSTALVPQAFSVKVTITVEEEEKLKSVCFGFALFGSGSQEVCFAISDDEADSTYINAVGTENASETIYAIQGECSSNTAELELNLETGTHTRYIYCWPAGIMSVPSYLRLYSQSSGAANVNRYNVIDYYAIHPYIVSFSVGEGSGDVPSSVKAYFGDTVNVGNIIPTPPPDGEPYANSFDITTMSDRAIHKVHTAYRDGHLTYAFSKWAGSDRECVQNGSFIMPDYDITMIAQFDAIEVNTYRNNKISDIKEAVGAPVTKVYNPIDVPITLNATANGGSCDALEVKSQKVGTYTFAGWNTEEDQSIGLSDDTEITEKNSTLYAAWDLFTSYTTVELPVEDVFKPPVYETTIIITLVQNNGMPNAKAIAGNLRTYAFLGWATSSVGNAYMTSYTPTSDNGTTLYAIFDSGTVAPTAATLPEPNKDYYRFLGWSLTEVTEDTSGLINGEYMPTADTTLYAVYTEGYSMRAYIWSSGRWWQLYDSE